MRRSILVLTAAILLTSGAFGLTVERGRLRLTLDEESSRFSLFLNTTGDTWEPLFYAADPRSSALDILLGNRVIRIGDSGNFSQVAEETEGGARYVWASDTLQVVQEFIFIRGASSTEYDAVQMNVTVTNLGEAESTVGVRLLIDTDLGEPDNVHFVSPTQERITREYAWDVATPDTYVLSPASESSYGFQMMLRDDQVTPIESAVVANWKRLSDSTWEYDANTTRNFNRLPYSINDSALLVTYPTTVLESGESYSVIAQFGDTSPSGYLTPIASAAPAQEPPVLRPTSTVVGEESEPEGAPTDTTPVEEPVAEEGPSLVEMIGDLVNVIDEIDTLLSAETVTIEDVIRVRTELERLIGLIRGR